MHNGSDCHSIVSVLIMGWARVAQSEEVPAFAYTQ